MSTEPTAPYRSAPRLERIRRVVIPSRANRIVLVSVLLVLAATAWVIHWFHRIDPPTIADAPPELLNNARVFPLPSSPLEPATPLAPLLASDEPEHPAVLAPREGATNVPRDESFVVRFNRPMVTASRVGVVAESSPIVLDPPVQGSGRWTSRSAFSYLATPNTWSHTHESRFTIAPTLRALSGERIEDETPRTVVFDGSPHLIQSASPRRITPGDPIRLTFEGDVDAGALGAEFLSYESGGGRRPLTFSLAPRGRDAEGRSLVDVRLSRTLEPGARVALVVAPMLSEEGDDSPSTMEFELRPRSRIEGIDCPGGASSAGDCRFQGPPGQIVDIAETLRLLATDALASLGPDTVHASPPVPGLTASVEGRLLLVRGDWAPEQVYELRVGDLFDAERHRLAHVAPLAIRSAGLPAQVEVATGELVYERDASGELPFAAVHVDRGEVLYAPVRDGDELRAALHPWDILSTRAPAPSHFSLFPLVPTSRANRWARGSFRWRDTTQQRNSSMAVVSFVPNASPLSSASPKAPAYVQATDLGVSARALPHGVLVWVTSLSRGTPVENAEVRVASESEVASGRSVAHIARSDAAGITWIATPRNPIGETQAIVVLAGDDRAVLTLDPRRAIGPANVGLAQTDGTVEHTVVASVVTDRGAYRPGETVHAHVIVRAIHGDTLEAVSHESVRIRQTSIADASASAELSTVTVPLSRFGSASADFSLGSHAALGDHTIEVFRRGETAPIGSATIRVAEYRQPAFRVDISTPPPSLEEGDAMRSQVGGAYLFGAPASGATAEWALLRDSVADMPIRWSEYTFQSADVAARAGTMDSGTVTLDAHGVGEISSHVTLATPVRQHATLEVEVHDASGQATAARRSFVAYPADFEVGVHNGPSWVDLGSTLNADIVAIAHDGSPAAGQLIQARIVREGWHSYWEWSDHARDDAAGSAGGYQARRAREATLVQGCALVSSQQAVHCTATPSRPGTYLLEATMRDREGRTAIASRRVYVAGPGEHPDRDPPGTAIAVTPARATWFVGERASVAVESPWPNAEAMLSVERDGVLYREHRHLAAGGSVFEFAVTREMVPNAFVSITLVRPRSGPTTAGVDFNAPDLRVGATELTVRPQAAPLTVALSLPTNRVLPGSDVAVDVAVQDAAGAGMNAEVTLYAVDEGTLRLTGYTTPDPTATLFPRRAPAFAQEDLRRHLVARIEPPSVPLSGGDGSTETPVPHLDDRERFDPTPLWQPSLVTDVHGRARATFHVPNRPTQYRIMALAMDAGSRVGRAATMLVATRSVVLRSVLPRFAIEGDQFEAAVFVHNTGDQSIEATVTATVDGVAKLPHVVHLEAGAEARVTEHIDVSSLAPIAIRFNASAGDNGDTVSSRVSVHPRGWIATSAMVGAVQGVRELTIQLPGSSQDDGAHLVVASHPFIGLEAAVAELSETPHVDAEALASTAVGLAAYAQLEVGPQRLTHNDVRLRGEHALEQLGTLQASDTGGFGGWSADDAAQPYLSAYALRAIEAARKLGWTVPAHMRDRVVAYVRSSVRNSAYIDYAGGRDWDSLALALRALHDADQPEPARVSALYDQRERLSPFALAQLAMAMDTSDWRRSILVVLAERGLLGPNVDIEDAHVRWYDSSTRTLGAVLEAATRTEAGYVVARQIASRLLGLRSGASWGSLHETANALVGLQSYARRFRDAGPVAPVVTLDGARLSPAGRNSSAVWFTLPRATPSNPPRVMRIASTRPAFFALDGRWTVPIGPDDTIARGRAVALHRQFETESGMPLGPGAHVHLGDRIRVRLFMYSEDQPPPAVVVRDQLASGFESVDAGLDTSPRASLDALLGAGPDDSAIDPRGFYAARSIDLISHRALDPDATTFYIESPRTGLHEFTYAIRATTVGTFLVPPAQLAARYSPHFEARSTVSSFVVDP